MRNEIVMNFTIKNTQNQTNDTQGYQHEAENEKIFMYTLNGKNKDIKKGNEKN